MAILLKPFKFATKHYHVCVKKLEKALKKFIF